MLGCSLTVENTNVTKLLQIFAGPISVFFGNFFRVFLRKLESIFYLILNRENPEKSAKSNLSGDFNRHEKFQVAEFEVVRGF